MIAAPPETRSARSSTLVRVLGVAAAVVIGLGLQHLLALRLDGIQELSRTDMLRARAELAWLFRGVGAAVFGSIAVLAVLLLQASRRAGSPGRSALAGVLLAASLAGAALAWYSGTVLLACRAGVG